MTRTWSKSEPPDSVDPLVHWRLVEMAEFLPDEADSLWWSIQLDLVDTSISMLVKSIQERTDRKLEDFFHLPALYEDMAAVHRDQQVITAFARLPFFKLIYEGANKQELGIERVVLGRLHRSSHLNFEAAMEPRQPREEAGAKAIMAVIDDGIALGHELFRTRNGSRVEFAWLQDGTPPNTVPGRELDRDEIDALLGTYTRDGWLDETGFYRATGLIDFKDSAHKTAAFRRAHGTHVAALAAGYPPGTHDESYPLIFVQLPAEAVADTTGDWVGPDLGLILLYLLIRAEQIAAARSAGNRLPLIINFSFGNFAGSHDGTDLVERLLDLAVGSSRRNVRVVLPAGNGNLARCHAELAFCGGEPARALQWHVLPDDRTASYVEIWLPHRGADPPDLVEVEVSAPHNQAVARISATPNGPTPIRRDGTTIGQIHYEFAPFPTERGRIVIAILPTAHETARPVAPSGRWRITVINKALTVEETVHLRIQRDDSLPGYPLRGRQSFFDEPCYERFDSSGRPQDSDPLDAPCEVTRDGTLSAFATGDKTVVVGGYVSTTGAPAVYSGTGPATPSRDARTTHRIGPDALAVSDDSVAMRGVISAGSGSGSYVPMNGTSVAAPRVARLVAKQLIDGEAGDRSTVQARAEEDELNRTWPEPRPDDKRGGGRLHLPDQLDWPGRRLQRQ